MKSALSRSSSYASMRCAAPVVSPRYAYALAFPANQVRVRQRGDEEGELPYGSTSPRMERIAEVRVDCSSMPSLMENAVPPPAAAI